MLSPCGNHRDTDHDRHNVNRGFPIDSGSISQLPFVVAPPAFHSTVGHQGTDMPPPTCDRFHPTRQSRDIYRGVSVSPGAIANLSVVIAPPTLDPTAACESAGMPPSSRNCEDSTCQPRHIHRSRTIILSTVTELPIVVVSPALHASGRGEGTAVPPPGRDGCHAGRESLDIDGGHPIFPRPITELSIVIISPTFHPSGRGEGTAVPFPSRNGSHLRQ